MSQSLYRDLKLRLMQMVAKLETKEVLFLGCKIILNMFASQH
ncbi:hypothetical protein HMPREF9724_02397 [Treponema denticola SP37]|uniref:Uncharacterized protein n=1 Tax=Treponema denticola OTK TaxID=999434 RepID=A0A0F6MRX8_TREDN|nr:hypothetical protein HMPREF9724_02397 [Treponema denticola SP37]EMB24526.1 hypothetical protein HMPREF9723_00214 [Treponema denticola OTK]EMB38026.1 hypothetical protein HMPREF9735_01283 [Treponema denticola ATCC 33521]EMB39755.1 hypothetical protein HMPREF9721_00551 [Treponema denticola ATCC 35404]EPF32596.1 hypothetical protein HMPREF9734_02624 [Treponema denticola SP44]EPF40032.1 hypothetical protein HMPREF9731_00642 [Treponema denticola SP23]